MFHSQNISGKHTCLTNNNVILINVIFLTISADTTSQYPLEIDSRSYLTVTPKTLSRQLWLGEDLLCFLYYYFLFRKISYCGSLYLESVTKYSGLE